jgi:multidrug efflux pump subunit AcrA (membrane-fusion protein)
MTFIDDRHQYSTIKDLAADRSLHTPALVQVTWAYSLFTYILIGFLLLFIVALVAVPWVQTVMGTGRVIGFYANERQQSIQSPVDGRIQRWYVNEGTYVASGDPIADIIDLDPHIIERLTQEKSAAQVKLKAVEVARDASAKNVHRQHLLAQKGLSSQRAVELAEIEYQKLMSDVSSATAELTRIEGRLSRQASQTIVAPRAGIIMRIIAPEGGGVLVKSGETLARLVPQTDDMAVELRIRGNDLPLLSEGRHVRLQFEGWPAVQFSGWPSVAIGTFGAVVKVIDASDDGTGSFRVIVVPEQKDSWPLFPYLRQGVRAHGWILLDSVSLGWELWRQLNGFPPTVSKGSTVETDPLKASVRMQDGAK